MPRTKQNNPKNLKGEFAAIGGIWEMFVCLVEQDT